MEEPQRKAQATYNAAAGSYNDPANAYWDRYGRGTVQALGPESAERVRTHNLAFAREHGVASIATNVIYGRATKAGA